jgi:hypothetical protein
MSHRKTNGYTGSSGELDKGCPVVTPYYNTVRLHSAIAYVTPADKLAGRAEAIWTARREKLATANARRRAKTKEKDFARPQSCEVH